MADLPVYVTINGSDLLRLWKTCERFIKHQHISCGEAVYQSDNVILNAYEFIDDVCNIVGFYDEETDSFSKS